MSTGMCANAFGGQWRQQYMPAHEWLIPTSGNPDPSPPLPWSNYWNVNYSARGVTFYHPVNIPGQQDMA